MRSKGALRQNIRHAAGLHALRKIGAIVDEENRNDAAAARARRWVLRYGWLPLLVIAALTARLMGVY